MLQIQPVTLVNNAHSSWKINFGELGKYHPHNRCIKYLSDIDESYPTRPTTRLDQQPEKILKGFLGKPC